MYSFESSFDEHSCGHLLNSVLFVQCKALIDVPAKGYSMQQEVGIWLLQASVDSIVACEDDAATFKPPRISLIPQGHPS